MTRRSWVYIDGVAYERGTEPISGHSSNGAGSAGPTILPDLPDFVSPIDGKLYSGRTGLRDHCARHDVVPTADLKGLPTSMPVKELSRAERREAILKYVHTTGVFKDQL